MNMTNERNADVPLPGDILITTEGGTHHVSVVPNPDCATFKEFRKAFQLAMQWANDHQGDLWRKTDGVAVCMFRVRRKKKDS